MCMDPNLRRRRTPFGVRPSTVGRVGTVVYCPKCKTVLYGPGDGHCNCPAAENTNTMADVTAEPMLHSHDCPECKKSSVACDGCGDETSITWPLLRMCPACRVALTATLRLHRVVPRDEDAYYYAECRLCLAASPVASDPRQASDLAHAAPRAFQLIAYTVSQAKPDAEKALGWICATCESGRVQRDGKTP